MTVDVQDINDNSPVFTNTPYLTNVNEVCILNINNSRVPCGRDRMVIGFTTTYATTKVVKLNPAHGKVYLIQHYVIKYVSDLWQYSSHKHRNTPYLTSVTEVYIRNKVKHV
jgi:hypothetical protein